MSTRGMIGIKVSRKVLGTYNHMDSYPEGLGAEVISFVRSHLNTPEKIDNFKNKVLGLRVVKSDEKPTPDILNYYEDIANRTDVSFSPGHDLDRGKLEFYSLLRRYQGATGLAAIARGELHHWIDNKAFLNDSLFCEYAYILDLNHGVLEFYEGFQQTDGFTPDGRTIYGPCKKVGSSSFLTVTNETLQEFYHVGQATQ
jgi:hypothetical protein